MPDYRKVHYHADVRDVLREIHRVKGQPDQRAILAFEGILEQFWQQTQEQVHADGESAGGYKRTGSLKHSGERESYYRDSKWHGRVRYGGEIKDGWGGNPGVVHDTHDWCGQGKKPHTVHQKVKYAVFEQQREGHNFMEGEEQFNNEYYRAIVRSLRRGDTGGKP
jgi:hypothetical protein